ncbi:MAG: hypothetical protein IJC59_08080 [Lachnospiraceae bacterium]|nr:hypothetical protein [Lachnospiraceae bacterium]
MKKRINGHLIFFAIVGVLFIFAFVRLWIWNKGEDSGYDPNEITTEFDTETMDYILPMTAQRLEGHEDDGVTSLLCLGNSPFAVNKGETGLAQTLARVMDGVAYDGSFANSFQSMKNAAYRADYPVDGVSLYHVTKALCSGDFSVMEEAVASMDDTAKETLKLLKTVDLSAIDMLVIMYDLSDYIDHRPVMDPNDPNNLVTWCGSLNAALTMIEEAHPHIRTVILSLPASGKTIDDFYVDGDIHDLGNGTLVDYINHEMNTIMGTTASFIDLYYGAITVDNRDQYLDNDYFLNEAGVQAIAERFDKFFGEDEG